MIYEKNIKNDVLIHIENTDNENPYTAIGSKAFLSCKNVYEIKLPNTILEIGDWAFAHMKDLKKIIVPANTISIGKDAFLDCSNLEEIVVYPDDSENKGLSYLLASCVTFLNSYDLLDFQMSVNNNTQWSRLYDDEILKFIKEPNDKGFQPFIVGWFNDEGEDEQLKRYIEKKKSDKVILCFLRLKYCLNISENTRKELVTYIKNQFENAKDGDNNHNAAWDVFKDQLSDDIQCVKAAVDNNILTSELKEDLITHLNKESGNPEIVAYLLSLEEEKENIDQIFEL